MPRWLIALACVADRRQWRRRGPRPGSRREHRPQAGQRTSQAREQVLERLTGAPFALDSAGAQKQRRHGADRAAGLAGSPARPRPGRTGGWPAAPTPPARDWRDDPGPVAARRPGRRRGWTRWARRSRSRSAPISCAPALAGSWPRCPAAGAWSAAWPTPVTLTGSPGCGQLCDRDAHLPAAAAGTRCIVPRSILGAKGGLLAEVTVGDVLELLDVEFASCHRSPMGTAAAFYRLLPPAGIFGPDAPTRCGSCAAPVQRTPAELIDRYDLACRPVRDLLVDYLCERAPALDYSSLRSLAADLGARSGKTSNATIPASTACTCTRGRRRVEAAAAHQAADRHHHWREDGRHRRPDRLPPVPDPGSGVLPGPGPVGPRGPRPLGTVGGALPHRRGGDQPAQGRPASQVTHGRPHPPTAARPARPGAHRRRAAQARRRAPAGRPPNPARGSLHCRRTDADPLRHHAHGRRGSLGR